MLRTQINDQQLYYNHKLKYFSMVAAENNKFSKLDRNNYSKIVGVLSQTTNKQLNEAANEEQEYYDEYELFWDRNREWLIKKRTNPDDPVIKFIPVEDTFDILYDIYSSNAHLKRDEMYKIVNKNYFIQTFLIDLFLTAAKGLPAPKKNKTNQPERVPYISKVVTVKRNRHMVILGVIDMAHCVDNQFSFILVYKSDNLLLLRPLTSKCMFEIASEIFKILTCYGPPHYFIVPLQDKDFYVSVKANLRALGIKCNLPLRAYQFVPQSHFRNILHSIQEWIEETGCSNWSIGCHVVQWRYNKYNSPSYTENKEYRAVRNSRKIIPKPVISTNEDPLSIFNTADLTNRCEDNAQTSASDDESANVMSSLIPNVKDENNLHNECIIKTENTDPLL